MYIHISMLAATISTINTTTITKNNRTNKFVRACVCVGVVRVHLCIYVYLNFEIERKKQKEKKKNRKN